MDFETVLANIGPRNIYMGISPDVADFTNPRKSVSLVIEAAGTGHRVSVPLPYDRDALRLVCGRLRYAIGGKRVAIGWNAKSFFSYVLARTGVPFRFEGSLYDLRVLESYVGLSNPPPEDYHEAQLRLAKVTAHRSWPDLKRVYSRIYNPLITTIVPGMETTGVVHRTQKKKLYANYDVAGQVNGRMKCDESFADGYNPHSVGEADRASIRPSTFDHVFLYLDYKNMEVATLQWLSSDEALGKILTSGEDVYEAIWRELTGLTSDGSNDFRQKCKSIFLPVAYGLGSTTLSEKIKVSTATGQRLWSNIYKKFPAAINWLQRQQDGLSPDGVAIDAFGRSRTFEEDLYRVRCFSVQSPASLLCLDKLVRLAEDVGPVARLVAHVHDGYVLSAHGTMARQAQDVAVKSLERGERIFPRLKVAGHLSDRSDPQRLELGD